MKPACKTVFYAQMTAFKWKEIAFNSKFFRISLFSRWAFVPYYQLGC